MQHSLMAQNKPGRIDSEFGLAEPFRIRRHRMEIEDGSIRS